MEQMICIEATCLKHVPKARHYQIIVFGTTSVHIPGDERSRTNPGHGYPEHTDTYNTPKIYVTTNEQHWRHDIELLLNQKPDRKDLVALVVESVIVPKMVPQIEVPNGG